MNTRSHNFFCSSANTPRSGAGGDGDGTTNISKDYANDSPPSPCHCPNCRNASRLLIYNNNAKLKIYRRARQKSPPTCNTKFSPSTTATTSYYWGNANSDASGQRGQAANSQCNSSRKPVTTDNGVRNERVQLITRDQAVQTDDLPSPGENGGERTAGAVPWKSSSTKFILNPRKILFTPSSSESNLEHQNQCCHQCSSPGVCPTKIQESYCQNCRKKVTESQEELPTQPDNSSPMKSPPPGKISNTSRTFNVGHSAKAIHSPSPYSTTKLAISHRPLQVSKMRPQPNTSNRKDQPFYSHSTPTCTFVPINEKEIKSAKTSLPAISRNEPHQFPHSTPRAINDHRLQPEESLEDVKFEESYEYIEEEQLKNTEIGLNAQCSQLMLYEQQQPSHQRQQLQEKSSAFNTSRSGNRQSALAEYEDDDDFLIDDLPSAGDRRLIPNRSLNRRSHGVSPRYMADLQRRMHESTNIYVYRNGIENQAPVLIHIPPSKQKNMKGVMDIIQGRMKYPIGYARYLYNMDGSLVRHPTELEMYNKYVVASSYLKSFKAVEYGRVKSPLLILGNQSKNIHVRNKKSDYEVWKQQWLYEQKRRPYQEKCMMKGEFSTTELPNHFNSSNNNNQKIEYIPITKPDEPTQRNNSEAEDNSPGSSCTAIPLQEPPLKFSSMNVNFANTNRNDNNNNGNGNGYFQWTHNNNNNQNHHRHQENSRPIKRGGVGIGNNEKKEGVVYYKWNQEKSSSKGGQQERIEKGKWNEDQFFVMKKHDDSTK